MTPTAWIVSASVLTAAGTSLAGPDGAAIVKRAADLYRTAATYTDTADVTFEMDASGPDGEDMGHTFEMQTELAFERPGRLLLQGDGDAVRCDGTTLWTAMGHLEQYTMQDAPEQLTVETLASEAMIPDHPVLGALLARDGEPAFPFLETIISATAKTVDGHAGTLVRGTGRVVWAPEEVTSEAWFSDATGLIESVTIDLTDAYKEMMGITDGDDAPDQPHADDEDDMHMMHGPTSIESTSLTIRLGNMTLNAPIDAATFAYTPEAGFEKVDTFSFDHMMMEEHGDQQALVGEEAPQIKGDDLDGNAFDLRSLRGQVVVLDFWATWCGPCVAAMPAMQALSDSYADASVAIVGINQDDENDKKVSRFLDDKSITFTQFMDDGSVGDAYGVQAIPCVVLIGKTGRVEAVHVGFGPHGKDQLKSEIERLLRGESLARAVVPADGL